MLPNPLFTFLSVEVHMYGLMIGVGLIMAFVVIYLFGRKKGVDEAFLDFLFYDGVASIFFGFVCAGFCQALYNYIEDPSVGFHPFSSGITFAGGFVGGAACFIGIYFLFRKKMTSRLSDMISILPCALLIGHAFGRIGCFFAGCCYGKETNGFLGVKFPDLPNPVYPTQLYEAVFLFLLFGVCSYLVMKKNFRHNLTVYLISYGVFRFLIEFLRGDHRGKFVGNISPSQFISLLLIVAGVGVYFLFQCYAFKKRDEEIKIENEKREEARKAERKEKEEKAQ